MNNCVIINYENFTNDYTFNNSAFIRRHNAPLYGNRLTVYNLIKKRYLYINVGTLTKLLLYQHKKRTLEIF